MSSIFLGEYSIRCLGSVVWVFSCGILLLTLRDRLRSPAGMIWNVIVYISSSGVCVIVFVSMNYRQNGDSMVETMQY